MTANAELDAGQDRRRGAGAAAGARGLPAQSGADHLLADAARARRRAGDRALGKPRLHRGRFRPAASRAASSARCSRRCASSCTRGESVPLAPLGTRMSDAILVMSTKGFGCVGITDARGKLVGIITDGDLRRHMRNNLLDARVDDVMTRAPKTVRPDQLISETLEMLNSTEGDRAVRGRGRQAGRRHPHPRSAARRRGVRRGSCEPTTAAASARFAGRAPATPARRERRSPARPTDAKKKQSAIATA